VALYLGIDGGGSKTTCAIGDEASVLATVVSGPSNITRVGEARARESLQQAIREACTAAKIEAREVECVCAGVAGAGREEVANIVRKIIAEVIPTKINVTGDMPIALEAAFGTRPGVIVIAGTGSVAYGRNAQGTTARAGGWGYAISDEGSAHWIGRNAVCEALRAADENENIPPLLEKLMQVHGAHSLDEFVRAANANPDFAMFFPVLVDAAEAGDRMAQTILAQAGRELARLAATVLRRLFGGDGSSSPVPVAVAGGVFRHARMVGEVFCDEICKLPRRVDFRREIVEPVWGALEMARRKG
jgi:glucosamine kinase